MPTTSNFGWTTPADTDLVKDGAAAIRTLGNGIDTSFLDLKGGTSGQVLSKNSNTDLDYAWVTPNVGDITEVQAGTGISVASGTGPIPVVTNSMATEITAKGDLIVGTGSGTFDNLPVGTNGYTLVADSVEATGLKWAAPAGGGKVLQVVTATTATPVTVASTTFADSGLTCNITPSSATSKIMVIAQQNLYTTRDPADRTFAKLRLMRGATSLFSSDYFFGTRSSSATREAVATLSVAWLDSPSTTSATTYKTQIAALDTANSGEAKGQYGNSTSSIILLEIGA